MTVAERQFCEYQYGISGSFMTSLIDAFIKADTNNLSRLSLGFPELASVFSRYCNESGYWKKLDGEYNGE